MSFFEAFVLGAVQGLTEFIPISSSGHLVVVPELFGWDHPGLSFDVLLHLGSLVALLIYFSGDLLDLARVVGGERHGRLPRLRQGVLGLLGVPDERGGGGDRREPA